MGWSRDLVDTTVLGTVGKRFYLHQIDRLSRASASTPGATRSATWPFGHRGVHRRPGRSRRLRLSERRERLERAPDLEDPAPHSPRSGFQEVELIELIPPFHQRVYAMGLEHVGLVVGPDLEHFGDEHLEVLTGRQFQSRSCRPAYRFFEDYTHVKFYERSLKEECVREGARFEGFNHAAWNPADADAGPYELGDPGE